MIFGERLSTLRKSRGITQEGLAKLLNVSRSTIAGYEAKNMEPDFEKLISLATYFDVSTDFLIGRTDGLNADYEIAYLYNQLNHENKIRIKERMYTLLELQEMVK